jgi:hypothetical protein
VCFMIRYDTIHNGRVEENNDTLMLDRVVLKKVAILLFCFRCSKSEDPVLLSVPPTPIDHRREGEICASFSLFWRQPKQDLTALTNSLHVAKRNHRQQPRTHTPHGGTTDASQTSHPIIRAVFLLLPSSSRLVSSGPSLSVSRLSRPIKTTSLQTQRTLFSCPTAPFHSVSNPTNIPYTTRSNHEASWTTRMDCRHGGGRICHGMRRYVMLYCA